MTHVQQPKKAQILIIGIKIRLNFTVKFNYFKTLKTKTNNSRFEFSSLKNLQQVILSFEFYIYIFFSILFIYFLL